MRYTDLELSPEEMERITALTASEVIEHIKNLPHTPRSDLDNAAARVAGLREPPPERGTDFQKLLRFLMQEIIPLSINTAHPAYLGYIPGGGLYPSALADYIAAATNRFVGAWFAAPAAARLETNVLEWFAQWMGYPASARGILTSGGSLANFSAIVTARKTLLGNEIHKGVLYASNQTHHSIMKAAMLAGLPEKNLRLFPVDAHYRARPELFEAAIKQDRENGLTPFLLVANAGTTNTGSIDPLPELGQLARDYGLWYHIDAAYGGFFNLCDAGRQKLRGIEQSDSLVLDPHKGLFVPYGTGGLLVKEGRLLRKAHMLEADYLQDQVTAEGEMSFTDYSPELSRSFRGLRVWLPLKIFGVHAFRENLAEKLQLTRWMYERFQAEPGFETFCEPDLSVIAFRYRPQSGDSEAFNRALLQQIVSSKKLFLSSTKLNGEFAIRVCILSFRTHRAQIEEAFEVIRQAARAVAGDD